METVTNFRSEVCGSVLAKFLIRKCAWIKKKRTCDIWWRFLSIYSWTQSWTASSPSPELKWPPLQSWPSKLKRYEILKIPLRRGHEKLIFAIVSTAYICPIDEFFFFAVLQAHRNERWKIHLEGRGGMSICTNRLKVIIFQLILTVCKPFTYA